VRAEIRAAEHLMRPSDEKIIFGSTKKFHKQTGWQPRHTLDETLASMLEYWSTAATI
jgi:GDP-4-dehydro-6-deoxy-D-mannose reductase